MNMDQALSPKSLAALVGQILGHHHPDPDGSRPPRGPFDPIIQLAFERTLGVFSPIPVPWVSGPFPQPWTWRPVPLPGPVPDPWTPYAVWPVSEQPTKPLWQALAAAKFPQLWDLFGGGISPQPQPNIIFASLVARTFVERLSLMQDVAGLMPQADPGDGGAHARRYVDWYTDELCGDQFRIRPIIPPGPRPLWLGEKLTALDLIVIGAELDAAGRSTVYESLAHPLEAAAERFMQAGLAQLS